MMDKSIAVVIPVYNGQDFIDRCLSSMIEQSELTEIIIVDDGSIDESKAIISAFANMDQRIKCLHHTDNANLGRSASRNLGVRSATSTWITFCDIDDYYLPDRFEKFLEANIETIDGSHEAVLSKFVKTTLTPSTQQVTAVTKNFDHPKEMQDFLISHREERISIISVIIKKSKIEEVGYFDEDLNIGEDTDFIWRLASISKLRYIPTDTPKIIRVVHDQNTYQDEEKANQARRIFYAKWIKEMNNYDLTPSAKNRIKESHLHYNGSNFSKLKSKLEKLL